MHEVNLFAVLKYYKHLLHILSASLYFIFKSVVTFKSQKDSELGTCHSSFPISNTGQQAGM